MGKKRVYILTEMMRSSKSGFFIEGTDIQMDYPDAYPLPFETEVIENGMPVAIRLLPHCSFLEKEQQIQKGYPEKYQYNDTDRKRLTFLFRRLELDESRDKIYIEFLERAAWKEGNELKKSRDTTKTIYLEYDEDAEMNAFIADESLVNKAKTLVFDLEDSELRNLYRLANPGVNRNDGLIRMGHMRKHLLDVAAVNPEFILNGVKTNRDKIIVLLSRALEQRLISMDFPGTIVIYNDVEKEFNDLLSVSDNYSREDKLEKLADYLLTPQGAAELAIIESKLQADMEVE